MADPQLLTPLERLADGALLEVEAVLEGDAESLVLHRAGDAVRAWLNVCPHAGRRLDWAPGRFLVSAEGRLVCAAHGASFELREGGCLLGSQQLEAPEQARTVRVREGAARVTDGPFAETKELLAGFNLIEADSLEDAVRIAYEFPWTRFGSIEVRPVRDFDAVRRRVGA